MKYTTSMLSKMLNVSTNTIRRFAEKGHLNPIIDEKNQYRYFTDSDVQKITYLSKYRKIGFSHDEISQMMGADITQIQESYQNMMRHLDDEIAQLQSLRHMVKDDINMMHTVQLLGDRFVEMDSVQVDYIVYKKDEQIYQDKNIQQITNQFLYDYPEIEYVYIFRKEDILNRNLKCEEAITIRSKLVGQKNIKMDYRYVEKYPKQKSILKIQKMPIAYTMADEKIKETLCCQLFDEYLEYMKQHHYCLDGDAIGVKISLSKENGKEMQYIVLGMPVKAE